MAHDRAEDFLAALESARVGVWDQDLRTGLLHCDLRCKELFGLPPDVEVTHGGLVQALHPADRHRFLEAIERAQQPSSGEAEIAFRSLGPLQSTTCWRVARLRTIPDPQGRAERLIGIVLDVSAEKGAAEELKRAAEEAERAHAASRETERRKDEFLAMLGHELRNPLAPILTALQLMRLKGAEGSERERTIIERQVRHLERLVEDLLDVSRITRGKIELRKKPVEIAQVVAAAIELASPLIEQKRHRLEVQVPRQGLLVEADEVRLTQAVTNLLTNAAKYTDEGGRITVSAAVEEREVVVRVGDSGAGIPPELLPHVFDLFTQGPQTLARARGGLGLGLAIVQGLVEIHGGTVAARSDGVGRGSEFVMRLPGADEVAARNSAVTPRAFTAFREGTIQRRVLIVDDNHEAGEVLADALTAVGHEVRWTADAPAALQLADTFRPEVVLLDIGLPVMDGYEVAQRLRARHGTKELRLIAITGYGQDEDRARALAAGFDMHFIKPVDLEVLAVAIEFNASHGEC
jgi:signal transduction histidine kinase/ActR/RegA family two-component response regulator